MLAIMMAAVTTASIAQAVLSGVIAVRSNPCLMAKYGHGQPCTVPALPDTDDTSQLVKAHIARAQFFIDLADLPQALRETDAALGLEPRNAALRHLAARLVMSTGDYVRAERDIAVALELAPSDPDIAASHAALLELQQNSHGALDVYNSILAQHPDHAFSRAARAKLFLAMAQPDNAIADFDAVLAGNHPDDAVLPLRARAYMQIGKPELAIADYNNALARHPAELDLVMERAVAYALAGDDAAALADFETVLGPVGAAPRYAIGGAELAKYRTQRALLLVHQKRFADAASEMADALYAGGKSTVLRVQLFLRHNGFPETPLDGRDSDALRQSLRACFGLNSCFQQISDQL
jgi:tetratricopeptide (TPR) repeat protein